jgi:hypothetical protein
VGGSIERALGLSTSIMLVMMPSFCTCWYTPPMLQQHCFEYQTCTFCNMRIAQQ